MDEYKKSLLMNWSLLLISGGINLYTLYDLSHSWPHQGSLAWFLLIFFCPLFLYHFIAISYALATQNNVHWKKSITIIATIIGFLLAGGILQYTQRSALRKFSRAYAPMVEKVRQRMPQPCEGDYFQIPKIATYNTTVNRIITQEAQPIGGLLYDHKRFIIHFLGESVDIVGSTIFFDSTVNQWHVFHNSDLQKLAAFKQQQETLIKCNGFFN